MTPNLRKRHRAVWLLLAILLPILLFVALWNISPQAVQDTLYQESITTPTSSSTHE